MLSSALLTAKLAKLNTIIFQSKYFFVRGGISSKSLQVRLFLFVSLKLPIADNVSDQKKLYKLHRAS